MTKEARHAGRGFWVPDSATPAQESEGPLRHAAAGRLSLGGSVSGLLTSVGLLSFSGSVSSWCAAAGLLTAHGSQSSRTQIDADLQQLDQTQIAASGLPSRTEADPYTPNALLLGNGLGMHRGAWSRLVHGKICGDHAVICDDLRSPSDVERCAERALPRRSNSTRSGTPRGALPADDIRTGKKKAPLLRAVLSCRGPGSP
jgi:hypothetical protein